MTAIVAGWAVVINTVFGVGMSLLLTGTSTGEADAVGGRSTCRCPCLPVVVGLALLLVQRNFGWFGKGLEANGIQIIFSTPGMIHGDSTTWQQAVR